ncbi:probable alpha-ketoglutarate-dependent hypophosphite dioxygenase [Leguminivora glycinivorella]|uniref:probable alpha-ketoglutarate-dependent hypophosphite dioxygenase n=1 Tax=Leguminivora glycinivorella TaxID=1035111 RepID=UPI00200EECA6|nr:probable alpha-ketoglutarate-dependent hypophosphite dioxygenase [Leguminivora glycinivorella]
MRATNSLQDYHYFPFKNDSMTAAFINFDDADPENGGLCIYPGSHELGPLKDVGTIEKGEAFHYMDPKEWPIEKATPVIAKRGDVVFFTYLTLHGSYRNLSDRLRRMLLIQVFAADDEPIKDMHKSLGQGLVLRGKNDKKEASHMIVTS